MGIRKIGKAQLQGGTEVKRPQVASSVAVEEPDVELELEDIEDEIEVEEVEEQEVEKPVFKPSPQIFSSVFVDKKEENIISNNEEEHVTEIKKEQKPMDAKLFSIIDDEDEEDIELPSLKNEEVTNDLDKINGEVYNLK